MFNGSITRNSCFWVAFSIISLIGLPNASACCFQPDVLESGLSCSDGKGCIKQYSTRGCNPQDPSDYKCMNFTNNCCNIVNYPDARETTLCHNCSPTCAVKKEKVATTGKDRKQWVPDDKLVPSPR